MALAVREGEEIAVIVRDRNGIAGIAVIARHRRHQAWFP
jgi:hypothetical protein